MNDTISVGTLLISSSLIVISLAFSYYQRLKLEKELLISAVRAVVQLVLAGYLLNYIFGLNHPLFTTMLLLFMIFNAAYNAAKRAGSVKKALWVSFLAIIVGTASTLAILVISRALKYEPSKIIPVSGMIISNSMVAIGLCYRQMNLDFKNRRDEVEVRLALGADILPSSIEIIHSAIKTGMMPTIDSAKTLGIVTLPGMMTGLILAGVSPIEAIKYQIMVVFMLLSTTAISSSIACFLYYKKFFNTRNQLL
jgi:putative ABC transport system permease protein